MLWGSRTLATSSRCATASTPAETRAMSMAPTIPGQVFLLRLEWRV